MADNPFLNVTSMLVEGELIIQSYTKVFNQLFQLFGLIMRIEYCGKGGLIIISFVLATLGWR